MIESVQMSMMDEILGGHKTKKIEVVSNQPSLEETILSMDNLNSGYENIVENPIAVLYALKDVIKAKRAWMFLKGENTSNYNEAWPIYPKDLPNIFLDRMTKLEKAKTKAYSELFKLVNGNVNAKIMIPGRKAIYLKKVLNKLEDATDYEFKGITYSRECKRVNMRFEEYKETEEFKIMHKKCDEDWKERVNLIDDINRIITDCIWDISLMRAERKNQERIRKIKASIA